MRVSQPWAALKPKCLKAPGLEKTGQVESAKGGLYVSTESREKGACESGESVQDPWTIQALQAAWKGLNFTLTSGESH